MNVGFKFDEMWIEGIGSNMGLLHSMYYHCIYCPAWELLCFHNNNQLLYSLSASNNCFIVKIDEQEVEPDIVIFPNPAREKFEVRSEEFEIEKIEVFDLQGRVLIEKQFPEGENRIQIDVRNLIPGTYFCKISSEKDSVTKKILIL